MGACTIVAIGSDAKVALLERVVESAIEQVEFVSAQTAEELTHLLQRLLPSCIIVDWESEIIQAPYFPRQCRRDPRFEEVAFIAMTPSQDLIIPAYNADYTFALAIEYTRVTYHTLVAIVRLIYAKWCTNRYVSNLQHAITNEQRRKQEVLAMIERLISLRVPEAPMVARFARSCALWIAERMSKISPSYTVNLEQLELAARLYALGRIQLSDADIAKPVARDGIPTTHATATVPESAAELMSYLTDYPETRLILLTMYENFDGTGFPQRHTSWHIPIGARILRAVVDYAEMLFRDGFTPPEALSTLQQYSRRIYDQRVVILLDEYVTAATEEFDTNFLVPLSVESLTSGMTLGRDIITVAGHKLAAAGTTLTLTHIERIITHHSVDPVLGMVYVLRN